jgi:hypothetical protein
MLIAVGRYRSARKPPAPPELPGSSWINLPQEKEAATQ